MYVWTIQPGLAFTDLQPKTRFQAHSRYLIRVLVSPDTKCVTSFSRAFSSPLKVLADPSCRTQAARDVLGRHDDQDLDADGLAAVSRRGRRVRRTRGCEWRRDRRRDWVSARQGAAGTSAVGVGHGVQRRLGVPRQRCVPFSLALSPACALVRARTRSLTYSSAPAASSDHTARLWELSSGTTVRQVRRFLLLLRLSFFVTKRLADDMNCSQYSAHHKACTCVALNDSSA